MSGTGLAPGKVGIFHYVLTDDDGVVIDRSTDSPMAYMHGEGQIVEGLEEALTGQVAGAKLQVKIPPEKGYGIFHEDAIQKVHRSNFPSGADIQVGQQFRAQSSEGHPIMVHVTATLGAWVTISANHPLAGKNLNFEIEIVDVRDATAEEIAHGHAHGPGGHHHH
jgi:FKBP-type peptidyl-prolyl cis-trans isomerase SlyD